MGRIRINALYEIDATILIIEEWIEAATYAKSKANHKLTRFRWRARRNRLIKQIELKTKGDSDVKS